METGGNLADQNPIPTTPEVKLHGSRILLFALLALFAISCAKGTVWLKPRTNLRDLRQIVVIPFQTNKPGLGDELSNRMVTALLQLGSLEVSDSAQIYAGQEIPTPKEIFEISKTDAVMMGSIRRYGNWFTGKNMNIDVKLVSRSGGIIWTCNYKTDWAFTGLGTEGSLASKITKEVVKRYRISAGIP